MSDYYVRADGTAATYDLAIGPASSAAVCMSTATLNAAGDVFSPGDNIYFTSQGGAFTDSDTVGGLDAAVHIQSSGSSSSKLTYRAVTGETPVFTLPAGDIGFCIIDDINYVDVIGPFAITGNGGKCINVGNASGDDSGTAGEGYTILFQDFTFTGQGAADADGGSVNGACEAIFRDIAASNIIGTSAQVLSTHVAGKMKAYDVTATNVTDGVSAIGTSLLEVWNLVVSGIQRYGVYNAETGTTIVRDSTISVSVDGTVGLYPLDGSTIKCYDSTLNVATSATADAFNQASSSPGTALVIDGCTINAPTGGGEHLLSDANRNQISNNTFNIASTSFYLATYGTCRIQNNTFNLTAHIDRFIRTRSGTTQPVHKLHFMGNRVISGTAARIIDLQANTHATQTVQRAYVVGNVFSGSGYLQVGNAGHSLIDNNTFYKMPHATLVNYLSSATVSSVNQYNIYHDCNGASTAPINDQTASDVITTNAGGEKYCYGNVYSGTTTNNATTYTGDTTALIIDPGFLDPDNEDFSPTNPDIIHAGAPWWLALGLPNPHGWGGLLPSWSPPRGACMEPGGSPFIPAHSPGERNPISLQIQGQISAITSDYGVRTDVLTIKADWVLFSNTIAVVNSKTQQEVEDQLTAALVTAGIDANSAIRVMLDLELPATEDFRNLSDLYDYNASAGAPAYQAMCATIKLRITATKVVMPNARIGIYGPVGNVYDEVSDLLNEITQIQDAIDAEDMFDDLDDIYPVCYPRRGPGDASYLSVDIADLTVRLQATKTLTRKTVGSPFNVIALLSHKVFDGASAYHQRVLPVDDGQALLSAARAETGLVHYWAGPDDDAAELWDWLVSVK